MAIKLRRRTLKGNKISLYLDIHHQGKRSHEFLNLYLTGDKAKDRETLRLAEQIRIKREYEVISKGHGITPVSKRKIDLIDYFQAKAKQKYKADHNYISALNYLKDFSGKGALRLSQIDRLFIERFQTFLAGHVSARTANTYLTKLRIVLSDAVIEGLTHSNPALNIPPLKIVEKERVYLTQDELQSLANTPCEHPQLKNAFLFACFTGLRISDVRRLRWENIRGDSLHFPQKKVKTFEYLPLNESALKLIDRLKRGRAKEHVFVFHFQVRLSERLRDWARQAGIDKPITFHSSRHTFATIALNSGVDLYIVSELLGHSDIKSTQIYAKIISERKKAAVKLFPKIEVEK